MIYIVSYYYFQQEAILLLPTTIDLHICQAYLTRLSCYWLHWTIALLSKPLSTQIGDNTQRCRVKYSCQQVHRLQKRISHRLECTQIAKARIPPSCSSSPLSPWAERVPFLPLNVSKTTQNCSASGLETLDWSTAEEKKKTKMPLANQPTRLKRIAIVKKSRWFRASRAPCFQNVIRVFSHPPCLIDFKYQNTHSSIINIHLIVEEHNDM